MITALCYNDILNNIPTFRDLEIITIDGRDGAGKTSLAKHISEKLKIRTLDLDRYITTDHGKYWERIDSPNLFQDINMRDGPLIISGLCINLILEQLNITPSFSIYIDIVERHSNTDDHIDELNKSEIITVPTKPTAAYCPYSIYYDKIKYPREVELYTTIQEYHKLYKPHLSCDIKYTRLNECIGEREKEHLAEALRLHYPPT